MSFIDQIDTSSPRPPSNPSPSFSGVVGDAVTNIGDSTANYIDQIDVSQPINRVRNQASNFLNPNRITGAAGDALGGFVNRSIDSLGRSVKEVLDEQIAKNATSPIRDAMGRAAGGLLGDFFEGFMDEQQNVPPQYSGTTNNESLAEDMFHADRYAMSKYNLGETNDAINDSHPMMKYMFVADFVFNTDEYYRNNLMQMFPTSLTLSLKNTTFPKMEIESDEINQYNRHVLSTKRVRYQPITSTFGESVSHMVGGKTKASMIEIWNKIASFYVNDFGNPDADYLASPLGHRSGNSHNKLLKYIDFYFIWPTATKRIRIVNPFISSFSYDNLDYGSDEQMLATFDIKYEYYQMVQVQGSFVDFINSPSGASLIAGSPYELVNAGGNRNIDVVQNNASGQEGNDVDDQRMTNLDNPYAQATLQLAEQEAISAASELLGSNDPVKRELGRQAVERSLDAGQTIGEATGIYNALGDTVQEIGTSVGRTTSSFITGLF